MVSASDAEVFSQNKKNSTLAWYAQWNPGTNTFLETSTQKDGLQKNRILIFALYLQNEAKV